jgi:hypothetical protein
VFVRVFAMAASIGLYPKARLGGLVDYPLFPKEFNILDFK